MLIDIGKFHKNYKEDCFTFWPNSVVKMKTFWNTKNVLYPNFEHYCKC